MIKILYVQYKLYIHILLSSKIWLKKSGVKGFRRIVTPAYYSGNGAQSILDIFAVTAIAPLQDKIFQYLIISIFHLVSVHVKK